MEANAKYCVAVHGFCFSGLLPKESDMELLSVSEWWGMSTDKGTLCHMLRPHHM